MSVDAGVVDDLRITGGRVFDPGQRSFRAADVAVRRGRIRAVGQLSPGPARTVIDASGLWVTPGLVDMHTHVGPGSGFWGMEPDTVAWSSGVTTWVDAGSAGAYGLDAFMRRCREFRVRTKALLHVSAIGLVGRTGESRDLSVLDVDAAAAAIAGAGGFVAGIKVRMDPKAVGGSGIRPLAMAVDLAEAAGLPVMAHVGRDDFLITEVLGMLRPGDIMTHCAGGAIAGIREPGTTRDAVAAAYQRGVILDVGHGSGGFRFDVMEDLIAHGMPPHVISSDLHVLSMYGPAFDLPTVMTKLMAVGLSAEDVFAATTITPARVLGLDGGGLGDGDPADFALWRCVEEPTALADVAGSLRTSPVRLVNVGTWVGGRQLLPMPLADPPSWVEVSDAQRQALARRHESARSLAVRNLVGPADIFNQITAPAAPAL